MLQMNEFCFRFMRVITNTSYRHDNTCHVKRSAHQKEHRQRKLPAGPKLQSHKNKEALYSSF